MTKNLRKIDISKRISEQSGFPILFSKKLVDDLLDAISENIKQNKLIIENIGKFKIILKKKRIGRNPKTKEEFVINARNSLSFIPSKSLRLKVK